jgi:SAM-dependent methyltransferase
MDNAPPPEEIASHYGPAYDAFIRKATEKRPGEHWERALGTLRKYKSGGSILDVGCGAGSFLGCLRGPSWQLHGLEMSEESARITRAATGAEVLRGELLSASFPPDTFDVITCFHVLEHLDAPECALHRMFSWLKPGGILCAHVPNIANPEARLCGSYWYALESPRHLYLFSVPSLAVLANSQGFEIVEMQTAKISFLEYSLQYVLDDLLLKMNIRRPALAIKAPPRLAWRVLRKAFRLMVFRPVSACIGMAGEGQVIEAIFSKPGPGLEPRH